MRIAPEPAVLHWLNASDANQLYLATITIAEISYGLKILPVVESEWADR